MDSNSVKKQVIKLVNIEKEMTELNNMIKELKLEKSRIEADIVEQLQDAGGMGCMWEDLGIRIGIRTSIVPTICDWESTLEYIKENDLFYLLNKSVKAEGWRELREQGIEVAGVTAFEKTTLSKTKYAK